MPVLFLLPSATATFVLVPNYNEGCNGNPFGAITQYRPIGHTNHALTGPTVAGGYLLQNINGWAWASSAAGVTSSAVQTAQYFMVGPHGGAGVPTCWVSGPNQAVVLTALWNVTYTPYLSSNCSGTLQSTAFFDLYLTANFHFANGTYAIHPFSPHTTIDAFVDSCGAGPYTPGATTLHGVAASSGPLNTGATGWGSVDLYTSFWASTNIRQNASAPAPAYSGVTWEANLYEVICAGC